MVSNNITRARLVILGSFLLVANTFCWHITVVNNTDFVVEANCKKVGAVSHHPGIVQPKTNIDVDCGAADCSTGIKITVYELFKGPDNLWDAKDIPVTEKWGINCGNKRVQVGPDGKGSYKIEVK
jgi:hypothetical protein